MDERTYIQILRYLIYYSPVMLIHRTATQSGLQSEIERKGKKSNEITVRSQLIYTLVVQSKDDDNNYNSSTFDLFSLTYQQRRSHELKFLRRKLTYPNPSYLVDQNLPRRVVPIVHHYNQGLLSEQNLVPEFLPSFVPV